MKTSIKNVCQVGFCMFGTLVGAGFASGKEIWVYFAKWGSVSFFMILLTALLFFFASLLFFYFGKKFQAQTVQKANFILYKKFAFLSETIMAVSNLLILSSMFAGADSLFLSVLPNFPFRIASIVSAIIAIFVVCLGFSGVAKTNGLIVPLLILCVGIICIFRFCDVGFFVHPAKSSTTDFFGGLLFGILFVCSNMFFSGFIFSKMGIMHTKKELLFGGIVGSILLFLSLFSITLLLFSCKEACMVDMPIVFLAQNLCGAFGYFVLFVVWLGLLSTAFAILFTITNWLKEYVKSTALCAIIICLVALVLSGIGFSSFVSLVYPMMGVLGFLHILTITFVCLKQKRRKKMLTSKK